MCRSNRIWIPIIACILILGSSVQASVSVAYTDMLGHIQMTPNPFALDMRSALAALGSPVRDGYGNQLSSAIPTGTLVTDVQAKDGTVTVTFSREILGDGLTVTRLDTISEQVNRTIHQFNPESSLNILVDGYPIAVYLLPMTGSESSPPAFTDYASIEPTKTGTLSGHSMTLSPGHGTYWNGSKWNTQRPAYGAPLNEEDYHNLEMCQYLQTYLENDGMTVKAMRCMDKSYGDHSSGTPWWKMASCYWLQSAGYPAWVYGSFHPELHGLEEDMSNDIRSRPLASNYDNTEIYVSVHTNGLRGDTWDTKPTGTEVFYDGNPNRTKWAAAGKDLAAKVADSVIGEIKENYDPTWTCDGAPVKNSNGAYGEIRLPERPAILLELGYHDTLGRDAKYLRDNFFRSVAMWGIYKGICDYYKVEPSWDFYSCQYFSDTIPSEMVAGQEYPASITLRNRGVLWTEAKQIRLGVVDKNPIASEPRQYISGEVAPNEAYTFKFTLKASTAPGVYTISWKMLREGVTWFGPCISRLIRVIAPGRRR